MKKQLTKHDKHIIGLFSLSVAIIILGFLFLINAMEVARIFPAYYDISNVLAKYLVVIAAMATGIMSFTNIALLVADKKLRDGLTIFITTFCTVLTLPLVYVFVAIFPYEASGAMGPVGAIMGVNKIAAGFHAWFGTGAYMYAVYAVLLIVSIVFITEPLIGGICVIKNKILKIGKLASGKFGVGVEELPIVKKQREAAEKAAAPEIKAA